MATPPANPDEETKRAPPGPGSPPGSVPECTAAQLFVLLWNTMADVIGGAATATLIRRSAKRAVTRRAGVAELVIARDGFAYSYSLPAAWLQTGAEPLADLRALVKDLAPLLFDLTGPVILGRLQAVPDLARCNLLSEEPR